MIMDNSKLRPREGVVKIVHTRYFTTAARLATEREREKETGNASKSTNGTMFAEGKRGWEEGGIATGI